LLVGPGRVAPERIVGVSASCYPLSSTIKFRRSFLLAQAHPGGAGKRAVKQLWCGVVVLSPYPAVLEKRPLNACLSV